MGIEGVFWASIYVLSAYLITLGLVKIFTRNTKNVNAIHYSSVVVTILFLVYFLMGANSG